MSENYKHFQNKECEFFPCHKKIDKEDFNCLFCYCPLYLLKEDCGGNYKYDEASKIKDCSDCLIPHSKDAYDYIMSKINLVIERAKKE